MPRAIPGMGHLVHLQSMKILQPRFIVFFVVMLIIPGTISYLGGWDKNLDGLFVLKAFAIASFMTVLYYLLLKNALANKK